MKWTVFLALMAALLFLGSLALPAQAQNRSALQELASDVFMPAPRPLRQRLVRARRALDDGRYSDAVFELGRILIPSTQEGGYDDELSEDFFIDLGGPTPSGRALTSLKTAAQQLLGSMPAKGRESFELQFGADARFLLEQAVEQGDVQKLSDVTRMYFHTRAGYEATMLLARYHLDQGRPLAGALCFKRLVDSPARGLYDPELSILLATCWLYADRPGQAEATLVELRQRSPRLRIFDGQEGRPSFRRPEDALAWLQSIVGPRQQRSVADSVQWFVYRGNAQRNAATSGGLPMHNFRWRVGTTNDPNNEEMVEEIRKQFADQRQPVLPSVHALAVNDVVLMRTPDRLLAVDYHSGKRIWRFPWTSDPSYLERWSFGANTQRRPGRTPSRRSELAQRLWDDSPHGQIATDGEAVFFLDELGYANPTGYPVQLMQGGIRRSNPNHPQSFNRLVALSLAKEGALLWMVGGADGEDEPKLAGAFFLGAPLPWLDQLYVLAEMRGEIRLVVLDRQTGRFQWSQQLANVEQNPILEDGPRRLAGASPSFADGILICPTSAGAVVAVDLSTRALLWGFQYERESLARSFNRIRSRQTRPIGQRWADATTTIADGRVLLTPVESEQMYCLDLLTGKSLWQRKRDRDEMLYVACVDDGQVVMIAKDGIRALNLGDGQLSWRVELADNAMPSGRGYLSDRDYYLPTTAAQLVQIDLERGQIESTVDTGFVLGNLICYQGDVISHGVDQVAAFHQEKPLREKVRQRLNENPDDAWALAWHGQLLLRDGDRSAALKALRQAFELDPKNDTTRSLLIDTLLAVLREDYVANQEIASELEQLIDEPTKRSEYLRLKAAGLIQAGNNQQAFATLIDMAGLTSDPPPPPLSPAPRLEQVHRSLTVRSDRWIQQKLGELYATADPAPRQAMDSQIGAHLEAAQRASEAGALRRFLDHFGFHPHADPARLALAERLASLGDLLEAELLLNQLDHAPDPAVRATAAARLGQLLANAGRLQEAGDQYRQLSAVFGDVVCLDGKTGQQLTDAFWAGIPANSALKQPATWPVGKIEVEETAGVGTTIQTYSRVYPIDLAESSGRLPHGTHVSLDTRSNSVVIRDGLGRSIARVSLASADRTQRLYNPSTPVTYWKANGHLLLLSMGFELVAIDLFRAAEGDSDAILWRQEIASSASNPVTRSTRVNSKRFENALGATTHRATDSFAQLVGVSAALHSGGFCFIRQRQLSCVDPLSGEPIWVRGQIDAGSDLFGDDQLTIVAPPKQAEALVFNALDGSPLGSRPIPPLADRWITRGRNVLVVHETPGDQIELYLQDIWQASTIWKHVYPSDSKACLVGKDEVAVLQPDGRLVIQELETGQIRIDTKVAPLPRLKALYAQKSIDRYLIVASGDNVASERQTLAISPLPGGFYAPLVNGRAYAFDAETGASLWDEPAQIPEYGFPLDQPVDLPVLTLMRRERPRSGNRNYQTSILWIDKRTGRSLKSHQIERMSAYSYELEGQPENDLVLLHVGQKRFSLKFSKSPRQPEAGDSER